MESEEKTMKLDFKMRLLDTLTSSLYEDPIVLFREYVQNSLDARNDSEKDKKDVTGFKVVINVDDENRTITIRDNGYAITSSDFRNRMVSLSGSVKPKYNIGFRGIGRLSAMPFCKILRFRSKAEGERVINVCEWSGEKYSQLLEEDAERLLEDSASEFVKISSEDTSDLESHFFEVVMVNYMDEIKNLIDSDDFTTKLKKLLPLRYSDSFTKSKVILEEYQSVFNKNLYEYTCTVEYKGENLYKEYSDSDVGASNIQFLRISESKEPNAKNIGLIWFSFDQRIMGKKPWRDKEIYGIMVRSKNILMGDNTIFAKQALLVEDPFTTYDEMVAALRGVSGELLIYSEELEDNARRDWFRMDEKSLYLRHIISDFLLRLHRYRYAVSAYYNAIKSEKKAAEEGKSLEEKKKAVAETGESAHGYLQELLSSDYEVEGRVLESVVKAASSSRKKPKHEFEYAELDVPEKSYDNKLFYDELMAEVELFLRNEKQFLLFNKLRLHIKNKFSKDESDGTNTPGGT